MTEAVIFCDDEHNAVLAFCEKAELLHSNEQFASTMFFQHAFCAEAKLSTIIGCNEDRRIFLMNSSCDGMVCKCRHFALDFLQSAQSPLPTAESALYTAYIRENISHYPLVAFMSTREHCLWMTCFSPQDIDVMALAPGVYSVQNCSLSYARSEHSEIIDFMRNSTDSSSSDVCHEALRKLHAATEYWPIMTDGICVGMNEIGRQVTCMTMDPTVIREKQEARIPRPKGPMTGFNYFSKTSRKRIFDEIGDEKISTNELNKVLGQRWRNMTKEEKTPYLEYAEEDRKRYVQEMEFFRQIVDPHACIEGNRPSKPLTAYNLFIHQEKQFIMGCDVSDTQTRIGKHGGDRWSAMPTPEKDLYMVLHEVGARDYI